MLVEGLLALASLAGDKVVAVVTAGAGSSERRTGATYDINGGQQLAAGR
jgi:hypothetical protein